VDDRRVGRGTLGGRLVLPWLRVTGSVPGGLWGVVGHRSSSPVAVAFRLDDGGSLVLIADCRALQDGVRLRDRR
jgi:hypothetical protein